MLLLTNKLDYITQMNNEIIKSFYAATATSMQSFHSSLFHGSRSNGMNVITGIHRENVTLASHLSRSVKVIGDNTDRSAANDFL